jgi:hypothetical protein
MYWAVELVTKSCAKDETTGVMCSSVSGTTTPGIHPIRQPTQ